MEDSYVRRCRILSVVNGETVDAEVDLGFGTFVRARFRLAGIISNEAVFPQHHLSDLIKQFTGRCPGFPGHGDCMVKSRKALSPGISRLDCHVSWLGEFVGFGDDGIPMSFNERMVRDGYAIEDRM